jgi:hypothetical protein
MAIIQAQCNIFKVNLLNGLEDFNSPTPYVYKIALYNGNATLNSTTTVYSSVNEVVGTGYTAGGKILTPSVPAYDNTNNTAYLSFDNVTWTSANFTTAGALIYNSTTNAAVCTLNFGGIKNATNIFTITFPTNTSTTAVIRIN